MTWVTRARVIPSRRAIPALFLVGVYPPLQGAHETAINDTDWAEDD